MKSKKILWIILAILILIVIAVATVAVLFFATDIFKTNDQLFWKYIGKNTEMVSLLESNLAEEQEVNMKSGYTSNGNLNIAVQDEQGAKQEIDLATKSLYNATNNRSYSELVLKGKEEDLLKVSYINSNNVYAIKCEDIIANYIGIRNQNLKALATNLGMPQEIAEQIPDTINFNSLPSGINLTEEQKQHLSTVYKDAILKNIPTEAYSKLENSTINIEEKDYEVSGYSLTLTPDNIKQILSSILNTFKNDEVSLKITLDILNKIDSTQNWNEQINSMLDEMITEIQEEITSNIVITVYTDKKEITETRISIEDEEVVVDLINDGTRQKAILSANIDTEKNMIISLEKVETDTQLQIDVEIIPDSKENDKFEVSIVIEKMQNNIINNIYNIAFYSEDGSIISAYYNKNIQIGTPTEEIQELTNSNTYILNNYSSEQLLPFLNQIINKASQVLTTTGEKLIKDMSSGVNSNIDINNITSTNTGLETLLDVN